MTLSLSFSTRSETLDAAGTLFRIAMLHLACRSRLPLLVAGRCGNEGAGDHRAGRRSLERLSLRLMTCPTRGFRDFLEKPSLEARGKATLTDLPGGEELVASGGASHVPRGAQESRATAVEAQPGSLWPSC